MILTEEQIKAWRARLDFKHSLHPRIVEAILQSHEELREALQWADAQIWPKILMMERGEYSVKASELRQVLGPIRRAHRGSLIGGMVLSGFAGGADSISHEAQVPKNRRDEELG